MKNKKVFVILIVVVLFLFLYNTMAMPTLRTGKSDLSTRGSTNKNPLNIKKGGFTDWKESTGYDKYGHAIFSTVEYGLRAALVDLRTKFKAELDTVQLIVNRWAEANTENYGAYVAKNSGLSRYSPIQFNKANMRKLTYWMAIWESKYYISSDEFEAAWKLI